MTCIVDEFTCPDCPPRWEHQECHFSCEFFRNLLSTHPRGHQIYHNTHSCDTCKAPRHIAERRYVCIEKCCRIIKCGRCGHIGCSWGPIGCRCDGQLTRKLPKLNRRSSRQWRKVAR
jgi:hypothetical protein